MTATVPPMSGRAFSLLAGQVLEICDVVGGQPGDLVAFKAGDMAVHLSQARSRVENGKVLIGKGDSLWTNTFPPEVMLTLTEDSHGAHDLLYPPCCRYALEKRFGVARDGCLENLAAALQPWGIASEALPDPLNLFFNVAVDDDGGMVVAPPSSLPGSTVALTAHIDCVVAISTCAVPFPNRTPSAYAIRILT